jgi:hypothetical protein
MRPTHELSELMRIPLSLSQVKSTVLEIIDVRNKIETVGKEVLRNGGRAA